MYDQTSDWSRHKSECSQFIEGLKVLEDTLQSEENPKKNQNPAMEVSGEHEDIMSTARKLWMEYDPTLISELSVDDSEKFATRLIDGLIDSTLSVENLRAIFTQEYGDSIAEPPIEFYEGQRIQAKEQMTNDLWSHCDEKGRRRLRLSAIDGFVKHFVEE
ncbi:hypothetical protein PROFUN_04017 [Planoprotostelium fungivorum]|uniref:Uncharacterized protein n=1 Tax=Planoprotostelium fungivorum TaxID=1890364 RepID=A0A2P6NW52_9EUKA|nr:hypothetical protein PROFUN_14919 [Planoprotostelium fungivorum]PRP88194.1 hypothetical protein PROFUN_04017 [Planoprotostelium fungivorum]